MLTCQTETCISHVFDFFLEKHDFTARLSDGHRSLKSCVQISASTRNAVIAIGALDLMRYSETRYKPMAVAHYKQSVSSLRWHLASTAQTDDATIWTSLLLAFFELMFDVSGTGFMLHFTCGLPALLRNQRLDRDRAHRCRFLLQSVQMLEVMRSASFWSYTQPTMLEDPNWHELMEEITDDTQEATSFTELYALMSQVLKLNNIVSPIVLTMPPERMKLKHEQQLTHATTESWRIYQELETWRGRHLQNFDAFAPKSIISSIYHITITTGLMNIFNFPHFEILGLSAPKVSADHLEAQIELLISLLQTALRSTSIAGPLLLWPIRVAGSKATRKDQVSSVLSLLREVEARGFAVARSFEEVLLRQWSTKALL